MFLYEIGWENIKEIIQEQGLALVPQRISSNHDSSGIFYEDFMRNPSVLTEEEWNLKEENDYDWPSKEIKRFPSIYTLNKLQENQDSDEEFNFDFIVRQPSQTLSVLEDFDESALKQHIPTIMLEYGVTKNDRVLIREFMPALEKDLENESNNLELVWENYTNLLKTRTQYANEIMHAGYLK